MASHIILAILILFVVAIPARSWTAGAAAAAAWSISRELTQAEYRWIEQFGSGLRANMPWWGGFDLRVWQKADPWLDWLLPVLVSLVIAVAAERRRTRRRSLARPTSDG